MRLSTHKFKLILSIFITLLLSACSDVSVSDKDADKKEKEE